MEVHDRLQKKESYSIEVIFYNRIYGLKKERKGFEVAKLVSEVFSLVTYQKHFLFNAVKKKKNQVQKNEQICPF